MLTGTTRNRWELKLLSNRTLVGWVSRHKILPVQREVLRQKLGDVEFVIFDKTYTDAEKLYEQIKSLGIKYAVIVLPYSMTAQLVQHKDITWLHSDMQPVHNTNEKCLGEKCPEFHPETDVILLSNDNKTIRHLRFMGFRVIKEVRIIFEEF